MMNVNIKIIMTMTLKFDNVCDNWGIGTVSNDIHLKSIYLGKVVNILVTFHISKLKTIIMNKRIF